MSYLDELSQGGGGVEARAVEAHSPDTRTLRAADLLSYSVQTYPSRGIIFNKTEDIEITFVRDNGK